MELVHREVAAQQKELMVGTVKGVLRAKVDQISSRTEALSQEPPKPKDHNNQEGEMGGQGGMAPTGAGRGTRTGRGRSSSWER